MGHPGYRDTFVTAEAVRIAVDTAGLGSRLIATIVDTVIQVVVGFALVLATVAVAGDQGGTGLVVFLAITMFVLVWGYYPLWEGLWQGRTPGKRTQGLRVVTVNGSPAGWGPILLRNLIRIVDFLPSFYGIGAIVMLVSRRSQRLGDLAAGTVVVRHHKAPDPLPVDAGVAGDLDAALDTTRLGEDDYALVRSFLQRRALLTSTVREQLARQLGDALRPRLGLPPTPMTDEQLLEAVARSIRARFDRTQP